jgi:hypothetical protein
MNFLVLHKAGNFLFINLLRTIQLCYFSVHNYIGYLFQLLILNLSWQLIFKHNWKQAKQKGGLLVENSESRSALKKIQKHLFQQTALYALSGRMPNYIRR